MQESYPIILIPESIQSAKLKRPELPEFILNRPAPLGPQPKRLKKRVVATQSAIAAVPGAVAVSYPKARIAGLGLVIAAFIAIAVRTLRQVTRYQQGKAAQQRHRQEMAIYQQEWQRHQREREEAIAAFQLKLILQVLGDAMPPDGRNSTARRGWSEASFQATLEHYFPGKIRTGGTVYRNGTRSYPYTPDFIFVDSETGLHVDIEIDEPYAYLNRKPTHYIGHEKDAARNQSMLERGWLVVRFSEEQVVRWPESCCKTLAEAIAGLMGHEILKPFAPIANLPEHPRWTKEEAILMAQKSSRQEYLNAAKGRLEGTGIR